MFMREDCVVIVNNKNYHEKHIKFKYFEIYNRILEFNNNLNISWLNKLYNYAYDIKKCNCKYCGNLLKFKEKFSIGYGQYCSASCTSRATREKVKETNLIKYGVEYPLQNPEILNKVKNTNLNKYGVISTLSSLEVQDKIKNTILNKYGVDNVSKSEIIKDKKKETTKNHYGVDNPFKFDEIKNKIKIINENKSDVEKQLIKDKIKQTNIKKYGVSSPLILNENRIKLIDKNLSLFGVEYPLQSIKIRNKINDKIKEIYFVDYISQSEVFKKTKSNNIKIKWSKILNVDENKIKYKNSVFTFIDFCEKHNEFNIKYDDLYNRHILKCTNICTKCNPISKQSRIKENELKSFIETLNFQFINNNRKILNGREIDIYLPEHKLAIEFNGLFWHSNNYVTNDYHLNKTNLCEEQGIELLHIFEDEWIYKKDIVKSIIKSKLEIFDKIIDARVCEFREINDIDLIKNFLNNNHIQGYINSLINIGLFYDNKLVSFMGFNENNNEYELLRFCDKLNTQVIGGVNKLLEFIINLHKPKLIITFVDRRYSNGNLYKHLGFEFKNNTEPNYWYFKKNELIRYNSFIFRKEEFNKNKTVDEIITERGFLKIYDCGNMNFIKYLV